MSRRKKTQPKLPKIGKKTVRSQYEHDIYLDIKAKLPKYAQLDYEQEKIKYFIEGDYLCDFVVTKKDGSKIYIECKGNGRAFDHKVKQKMIAVKQQHPDLDLRIMFYRDGKVGATRRDGTFMKQSDWAKKYGFVFAIGNSVPTEWLNE